MADMSERKALCAFAPHEVVFAATTTPNRFYIGSARAIAARAVPQIDPFGVEAENALDKMCLRISNRPRTVAAAGGATQEVQAPMPVQRNELRYTVFAVSRNTRKYTSDDGIPWGHCRTEEVAKVQARWLDQEREAHPTRIVERERVYPFKELRVVWRCDSDA
jgi:hypothetical protein